MMLRRYHETENTGAVENTAPVTIAKESENENTVTKSEDEVIEKLPEVQKEYGKTEINRMSKDDLVVLAKENGLEVGEEESGASLKKRLIELLVK